MSSPRSPRVLIVEDEAPVRLMVARLLADAGFEPVEAPDARSALAALQRTVDLLVLDLHLPDRSGMEVLAAAHRDYPDLPVIVVTGGGTIPCAVEAIRGGAFDYLTKPFRTDELVRTAQRAVAARASRPGVASAPPSAVLPPRPVVAVSRPRKSTAHLPCCPSCTREPLAASRVRWYEYPLLLSLRRPYRCPLCYGRYWRPPAGRAERGTDTRPPAPGPVEAAPLAI